MCSVCYTKVFTKDCGDCKVKSSKEGNLQFCRQNNVWNVIHGEHGYSIDDKWSLLLEHIHTPPPCPEEFLGAILNNGRKHYHLVVQFEENWAVKECKPVDLHCFTTWPNGKYAVVNFPVTASRLFLTHNGSFSQHFNLFFSLFFGLISRGHV